MPGRKAEFSAGIRGELPLLLGVMPFGMLYGVMAVAAGLAPLIAQAMSAIVFAGSAQFVAAQLFGAGAPWFVILVTTLVINLRHLLYGASMAPYLRTLSRRWRCLLAYLLTDEAYAVAIMRYRQPDQDAPHRHWFTLGAGLTLWAGWQLSTAAGIFLGAQAPAGLALEFTLVVTFIAIVVPGLAKPPRVAAVRAGGVEAGGGDRKTEPEGAIRPAGEGGRSADWPSVAAAVVAGGAAVAAVALPYKLGLLVAAALGIAAGLALESRPQRRNGVTLSRARPAEGDKGAVPGQADGPAEGRP